MLIAAASSTSNGFNCPRVSPWKVIVDVPIVPSPYTGLSKIGVSSADP